MKISKPSSLFLLLVAPVCMFAQKGNVDEAVMSKIRNEGLQHSSVREIAFQITEKSGPRVTNSAGFMRAAVYAKDQFNRWGLVNARLDPWGEFGKGWELKKSYVAMVAPWYRTLIAHPKTWTAGTGKQKNRELVLISAKDTAAWEVYSGKLKGKILILDSLIAYEQGARPGPVRRTDEELQELGDLKVPEDTAALRIRREKNRVQGGLPGRMLNSMKKLAEKEGAIAVLSSTPGDYGGTVFVMQGGPYKASDPDNFLDLAIGLEDYNMMVRLLRSNTPVQMELDVRTEFQTKDTKGYNVIAEIPGEDAVLKDEIVMLGAHLDSWPAATGATDNAAGVTVMMEAVRILKAIGAHPRRTIRIALWSGEEQGLLGSKGYVKKTFGDPATMELLPDHGKFSVYFNLDYGTGRILGIQLQGNEAARNIFQEWLDPFKDLRANTVSIQNSWATDHLSFDELGLPGFQFIQDRLITQHSNMDSYDHLSADDLKQSATIVAALVYDAAMSDHKIPRKELPKPKSVSITNPQK